MLEAAHERAPAAADTNYVPLLRGRLRRAGGADGRGGATISGDPAHPANFGRLCSKGSALGETLGLDRTAAASDAAPARRFLRARRLDERALDRVAEGFERIIERDGPDAVAFYLSGQLLTEDYYVANKLMKGFLGSANVDTNSRLCMASTVAGHRRAFGDDTVPGTYEDLERRRPDRAGRLATPPGAIRCCTSAWWPTSARAARRSS